MRLKLTSKLELELESTDGLRTFILTPVPAGLILRQKGRKIRYGPLPWGALFDRAAKLTAGQIMQEKAEKKVATGKVKLRRSVRRNVLQ